MPFTQVVATDGPRFEVLYGMPTVVRRSAAASEIAAALFVNGQERSFVDNTMVQNGLLVREGEWVQFNRSSGKWDKAIATAAPAYPVWQDPGVGRRDAAVGGLTFLQGKWTVATNMITDGWHNVGEEFSTNLLVPGTQLKVVTLPAEHAYAGATGLGPINWDDGVIADPTDWFYVVAHVEQVIGDVVVITNEQAGYKVNVSAIMTTVAPTTAAPTTAAPTTAAPTTPAPTT